MSPFHSDDVVLLEESLSHRYVDVWQHASSCILQGAPYAAVFRGCKTDGGKGYAISESHATT